MQPDEGLTMRDLMLEVRNDIRVMSATLDQKAERTAVTALINEVATLRLLQAGDVAFIREKIEDLPDHEVRIRVLERFRYAIPSVSVLGFGVAVITAAITFTH